MENILSNVMVAAGIVIIFAGISVEAVKRMELIAKKYLPGVSIVIGILCGIAWALGFNQDLPTFIAAGFIAGAAAAGLFDLGKPFLGGK